MDTLHRCESGRIQSFQLNLGGEGRRNRLFGKTKFKASKAFAISSGKYREGAVSSFAHGSRRSPPCGFRTGLCHRPCGHGAARHCPPVWRSPSAMYLSPSGLTFEAMLLPPPHISPLSETDWLFQFHTGLSVAANRQLHALATMFRQQHGGLLQDVVVAYDSLLLRFQQPQLHAEALMNDCLKQLADSSSAAATTNVIAIPVCYDPTLYNDLQAMAQQTSLPVEEIIALHSAATYHIYMLGFLPGFAYMGSVNEQIALPRKAAPVPVKAGAVGIAGTQTGIYPTASPGGWNIVGYTPLQMFDAHREPACLLQPGQQVRFVPVSLSDFKSLQAS